jgi:hypothetical protein
MAFTDIRSFRVSDLAAGLTLADWKHFVATESP